MELVLPDVSSTLGPLWASILNTALTRVDQHDHSEDNGVKVTPAGLDINADLDFQSNDLLAALSLGMTSQDSAVTSKLGSMQVVANNLYYINGAGVAVQLTSGSSIISTGSGVLSVSVISSYPYTILTSDAQRVLIIDTSSARTLTLPAASNAMTVYIKDGTGSTNAITVTPDGSDTIDGVASTYTMNTPYGVNGFISDGVSAWYVI